MRESRPTARSARRRRWCANCFAVVVAIWCTACRLNFSSIDGDAGTDGGAQYFTIGGTVMGLPGGTIVLQLNGGEALSLTTDGPFMFVTPILKGEPYVVNVFAQPTGATCSVAGATGIVGAAPITEIEVICYADGSCPASPITFAANSTFTLPTGCSAFTVDAYGGGGAGGGKNQGDAAAAGGGGGRAVKSFVGESAQTVYAITPGTGGTCGSTTNTPGGYSGGGGGSSGGFGDGANGDGASAPPGGIGGTGSTGTQPGGAGGNGGYGGGGGGGGGDVVLGNSGGGATTFQLTSPLTNLVVAGGGGGAGAADQNGDAAGAGGAACNGYNGSNGLGAIAGTRSGGGGGGGACACIGGCNSDPTPNGAAGGIAATSGGCTATQNGSPGRVIISFP